MDGAKAISVRILDKDYLVACPDEERQDLLAAARFLDRRMRDVRDGGKVIGSERIAVITALNIAHELLQKEAALESRASDMDDMVRELTHRVEAALGDGGE